MKKDINELLKEYNEQTRVDSNELYEHAYCDDSLGNLCCLLHCLNCCCQTSATAASATTTTTTTPTYDPNIYADFKNVVDPGGLKVNLLTHYNGTSGLYTFHLYYNYMKIEGYNAETKIRTFYKIDYSNISRIETQAPYLNTQSQFFFQIFFKSPLNYYVNDNFVNNANLTSFIVSCYANQSSHDSNCRYTENFVNDIFRKLNEYEGTTRYQYVNFTNNDKLTYNTNNVKTKTTTPKVERPRPIEKVDNEPVYQEPTYNENDFDYDEDDGYDYGDDDL